MKTERSPSMRLMTRFTFGLAFLLTLVFVLLIGLARLQGHTIEYSEQIAFVGLKHGNLDIHIIDVTRGLQTRLTHHESTDESPVWSPDGKRIAFVSWRDGNPEIYVMDADGDNLHNLTQHPALDTSPAWSPDGNYLVFTSWRDGNGELYLIAATGGDAVNISQNAAGDDRSPDWSKDGSYIVYESQREGRPDIYIIDIRRMMSYYAAPANTLNSNPDWRN